MPGLVTLRLIPEWNQLVSRLVKTLEAKEHKRRNNEYDKEDTIYLDVHPSIKFSFSCPPSDHLHCITAYSGQSGNVVLSFQWSETELKHQVNTWMDDGRGKLQLHSTTPVYGRYKIENMLFIPSQRVLVGYCNDMSLRLLTDNRHEMVVVYQTQCSSPVICMHYCQGTSELLTGSMGHIAFWGFWASTQRPLSLLRILNWTNSSLERETQVSAFESQQQKNCIYALCDYRIKCFEHHGKSELFEFRGRSMAALHCVVADWRQRYLYTGDAGGYVQSWSCDIRRMFLQFRAHTGAITALVLMPESGSIFTACKGCAVKQWTRNGELLLKLPIDMPGGIRSMWRLCKNVIMCQSGTTLDVWRLNSVYKAFNDTACGVRTLRRLECGRAKGRILAVTLDGIIRFISTVTGELLLLSWPFLYIDKALGFAYHPGHEDLYICDGSPEILVLNTTLNPCPVKRVIKMSVEGNDGVLCLETVMVWGSDCGGGDDGPVCLIFSGHWDGTLQLLAPPYLICERCEAHREAVCQMSSISGMTPTICCYGADEQFSLWSVRCDGQEVALSLITFISCHIVPVHLRLMRGVVCAVSTMQQLFFFPVDGAEYTECVRKKTDKISCLDYCPQLDLLALCGDDGKVEIWTKGGGLVAEVKLGVPVTQICFGNARGDIFASFSNSISIISVTQLLPTNYLRAVLEQAPIDDIIERPVPFLPKSPMHYDIDSVPKMYLKHLKVISMKAEESLGLKSSVNKQQEDADSEELNRKGMKSLIRPCIPRSRRHGVFRTLSGILLPGSEMGTDEMMNIPEEILERTERSAEYFSSLSVTLPQGGYIPNSVIRGIYLDEDTETKKVNLDWHVETATPRGLRRRYIEREQVSEQEQEVQEIIERVKASRPSHEESRAEAVETLSPEMEDEMKEIQDTKEVKQQLKLNFHKYLGYLNTLDRGIYVEFSEKLMRVYQSLGRRNSHLNLMQTKFLSDVTDESRSWLQFEALKNLEALKLLNSGNVQMVGSFLTHENQALRDLGRDILKREFHICEKSKLRSELQKTMTNRMLNPLLNKLSDDLQLLATTEPEVLTVEQVDIPIPSKVVPQLPVIEKQPEEKRIREDCQVIKHVKNMQKKTLITTQSPKKTKEPAAEGMHQMPEEEIINWFPELHQPEPKPSPLTKNITKSKKKKPVQKKEHQSAFPDDPLLYVFRHSRACRLPAQLPEVKLKSELPPIDSALSSFRSQDTFSDISSTTQSSGYQSLFKFGPQRDEYRAEYYTDNYQPICRRPKHSSRHPQFMSKGPQQFPNDPQQFPNDPQQFNQHVHQVTQDAPQISQDAQQIFQDVRHAPQYSQHISKEPQQQSLEPLNIPQRYHPNSPLLHPSRQISQHSLSVSESTHDFSQYPEKVPHHIMNPSPYLPNIPEKPQYVSEFSNYNPQSSNFIPMCPENVASHSQGVMGQPQDIYHPQELQGQAPLSSSYRQPWHLCQPSQNISQDPNFTAQQPHPSATKYLELGPPAFAQQMLHYPQQPHYPYPKISSPHLSVVRESSQPIDVEEGGELHWRQSLHKLISMYGFRSHRAAKALASLCAEPVRSQPRRQFRSSITSLPQILPRPRWRGALGERVMQGTELTPLSKHPLIETKFRHELPLPWRLGHLPLDARGRIRYGRLEVEWVRAGDIPLSQREDLRLPKINTKGFLSQT